MKRKRKKQTREKAAFPYRSLLLILLALVLAALYLYMHPELLSLRKPTKPTGRPVANTVELQIALARKGFSPGSIDGAMGLQTRQALAAFQMSQGLPVTDQWDQSLDPHLRIEEPTHALFELTSAALLQIRPEPASWRERGQLDYLGYHSILEMVAEKACADPDYIRAINPAVNWSGLLPGDRILAPLVPPFRIDTPIAEIQIELAQRQLRALDASGHTLFHCPVSIARDVAKRPVGQLEIVVRVEYPNYTFNPEILSNVARSEGLTEKFIIQPGPNNPVGTVWLGLNRPSYGIHGTPAPENVGRSESSGCFRLANWNAETLLAATEVGTPVIVLP